MTDQEKNEFCAEALGYNLEEVDAVLPSGDKVRKRWAHGPNCITKACEHRRTPTLDCGWPKDFLHSEDANAMLLEAMPWPQLEKRDKGLLGYLWACFPNLTNRSFFAVDRDRRTAVINAFVAFIEAGGKVNG